MKHNLEIANKGAAPTFDSHLWKSIIDVTLVSPDIADRVSNWKVLEQENFSDHNTIQFGINTPKPEIQMKRNYAKLDLKEFHNKLSDQCRDWVQPEVWTLHEIEKQERISNSMITN